MSEVSETKSREEIEELKVNWRYDPNWNIEQTEGFEAHYDELRAFNLQTQLEGFTYRAQKARDRVTGFILYSSFMADAAKYQDECIRLAEWVLQHRHEFTLALSPGSTIKEASKKSREEIEQLKTSWEFDPCWDIEDTEGFEAHRDELRVFHLQTDLDDHIAQLEKLRERIGAYRSEFLLDVTAYQAECSRLAEWLLKHKDEFTLALKPK